MTDGIEISLAAFFEKSAEDTRRVSYSRPPEFLRPDWENGFTKPGLLAGSYRLLVHGLSSSGGRAVQKLFLIDAVQKGSGNFDDEQDIDLLQNPHEIHKKKIISASCVDQDHRATFGEAGLILAVPFENVLSMSSQDAGTDFSKPSAVLKANLQSRELMPLNLLMSQASATEWNEIRLTGETEAGRVRVVGFFVKVDKQGAPLDPEIARDVRGLAMRHGLPLVEIKKPTLDFKNEKASIIGLNSPIPPHAIAYGRDGLRYVLSFDGDRPFSIINEDGKSRHMTKAEARAALQLVYEELSAEHLELAAKELNVLEEKIPNLSDEVPVQKSSKPAQNDSEHRFSFKKEIDPAFFNIFEDKFKPRG